VPEKRLVPAILVYGADTMVYEGGSVFSGYPKAAQEGEKKIALHPKVADFFVERGGRSRR